MSAPNYFPPTLKTAIVDWLGRRDTTSLNQHLFHSYYEPIRLYLKGSRWFASRFKVAGRGGARESQECEELNELVNGFFSDLLERADFFDRWLVSGSRLGQYLRGALWLYLKGQYRDQVREMEACQHLATEERLEVPPDRELDKAFVSQLVAQAMEEARTACERKGFGEHWQILLRHFCQGATYPEIARELSIAPDRAAVMLRTAANYFERAFRALVSQQVGDPEHVRRAIENFLQVIES